MGVKENVTLLVHKIVDSEEDEAVRDDEAELWSWFIIIIIIIIIISFIWTGTVHNKTLPLYITRRGALHQVLASCYFPPVVSGQVDGTYNSLKTVTKLTVVQNFKYSF